jgi:hypothetical protein
MADVIGDPLIDALIAMNVSSRFSDLIRQVMRPRLLPSRFAPRLPDAFLQCAAPFEAIFRWNPAERPLIRAISKDPLFTLARGFQQLAMFGKEKEIRGWKQAVHRVDPPDPRIQQTHSGISIWVEKMTLGGEREGLEWLTCGEKEEISPAS